MLLSLDVSYRTFARNHFIHRTSTLKSRQRRGTSWTTGTHMPDKDGPVSVKQTIIEQRAYHDLPSNARTSHHNLAAHGLSCSSCRPFSTLLHLRGAAVAPGRPTRCYVRNKSTAAASGSQSAATSTKATENKSREGAGATAQKVKGDGKGKGKAEGKAAKGVKQAPNGKKSEGGKGAAAQKPGGTKQVSNGKKSDGAKETPGKKSEGMKEATAKQPEEIKVAPTKKTEEVIPTPVNRLSGEEAPVKKAEENEDPTQHLISLTIHCDGSLTEDNHVGAAAILSIPGQQDKIYRRHFVDHDKDLTSLDAEMISLVLGLVCLARYMLTAPAIRPARVTIACDNTSAVTAANLSKPGANELHTLLLNRIRAFKNTYPDIELVFVYVAGHSGVEGNQRAHVEARLVARDPSTATNEGLPDSLKRMLPGAPKTPRERVKSTLDSVVTFLLTPRGMVALVATVFVVVHHSTVT